MLDALGGGGAYFFRTLVRRRRQHRRPGASRQTLWDLVWSGHLSNDTLAPLRALLAGGRTAHRAAPVGAAVPRATPAGPRRWARCPGGGPAPAGRRCRPAAVHPPRPGAGPCCPPTEPDATVRVLRHRRGAARPLRRGDPRVGRGRGRRRWLRRRLPGARRGRGVRPGAPRLLRRGPGRGAVRRPAAPSTGSGPRAARCPSPATRTSTCRPRPGARADPARRAPRTGPGRWCWPPPTRPTPTGRPCPGRERDGEAGRSPARPQGRARWSCSSTATLSLYVERGGKTLLSWTDDAGAAAGRGRRARARGPRGRPGQITVEKADGGSVLGSDHPLAAALAEAGFHATPRGLRLRR